MAKKLKERITVYCGQCGKEIQMLECVYNQRITSGKIFCCRICFNEFRSKNRTKRVNKQNREKNVEKGYVPKLVPFEIARERVKKIIEADIEEKENKKKKI